MMNGVSAGDYGGNFGSAIGWEKAGFVNGFRTAASSIQGALINY